MKIYQQGDLDQTCFLYSIANAYRALTGRRVDDRRRARTCWEDIINVTPSISQFLTHGSDFYDSDSKEDQLIHESIVWNAFEVLSPNRYQFRTSKISTEKIKCTDFMNSVIIFCINHKAECEFPYGFGKDSSHWVVIVGRDTTNYLLACSCTRLNRSTNYEEYEIQGSGRLYNNKVSTEQLDERSHIYPNYIYKISIP